LIPLIARPINFIAR